MCEEPLRERLTSLLDAQPDLKVVAAAVVAAAEEPDAGLRPTPFACTQLSSPFEGPSGYVVFHPAE